MKIQNIEPEVVTHHAISGSFGRVNFFLTTLDLRDAAENLQLLPQQDLSFKERIQRVVNEERVKQEILPYLQNDPDRFFNSLVCVLLPDYNHSDGFWDFTPYTGSSGPIGSLGCLRISKKVARVVLDGQHRYRALQLYWEQSKTQLQIGGKIDVPVTYAVIDNIGKFGQAKADFRQKTTESIRRLFTVLNKNAKLVDKTTLLLIDDSDTTNVISRKLLEERVIDELLVKWFAGDSLNPSDPYFTTLHTVRDFVRALLIDYSKDWDTGDSRNARDELVRKYYSEPTISPLPLCDIVRRVFSGWSAYSEWRALLKSLKVSIPRQPLLCELPKTTKAKIEAQRKASLVYTVAGQRSILKGLAAAFLAGSSRSEKTLDDYIHKLNLLQVAGMFSRKNTKSSPNVFHSVLFDEAGRMIWANSSTELSRKIIAVALGAALDRDSILKEYSVSSYNSPEVLIKYWADCELIK